MNPPYAHLRQMSYRRAFFGLTVAPPCSRFTTHLLMRSIKLTDWMSASAYYCVLHKECNGLTQRKRQLGVGDAAAQFL